MSVKQNSTFQDNLRELYKKHDTIAQLIQHAPEIPKLSLKDYDVKFKFRIRKDKKLSNKTFSRKNKGYIGLHKLSNNKTFSRENKEYIELDIEKIFGVSIFKKDRLDSHRILISGEAGAGKTVLTQYIEYKWAMGELWNDKFDYVYQVPLRTLFNDEWGKYYYGRLDQGLLKCLAHYNLTARKEQEGLDFDQMCWLEHKDRILLLLDGYDEIAHRTDSDDFYTIKKEIFQHENLILTSRPNFLITT